MSVGTARAILGVTRTTPMEDVRAAHRALMLKWHPDKATQSMGVTEEEANEQFVHIGRAYACINAWHAGRTAHSRYAPRGQEAEAARDDVLLAERRDQEMREARQLARREASAKNRARAQVRLDEERARARARDASAARVAQENASAFAQLQADCAARTRRLALRVAGLHGDRARVEVLSARCNAHIRKATRAYTKGVARREQKHRAAHTERISDAQRHCDATFAHKTWWVADDAP